jgi:ribosomal protein S18 acetylase RimI-like enzyme
VEERFVISDVLSEELPLVHGFYEAAIAFQKLHDYNVWNGYAKELLVKEARDHLLHKLEIDGKIALVFSAIYSDKLLWHETDRDDAVYVHRLAVNPEYRGRKLFRHVFAWLLEEAKNKKRKFLRLDTWGDNPKMIRYYESFGYRFVRNYSSGNDERLPPPHRNLFFALMEYEIPN